jgi:two-component system, NtrC family, response regulator
MKKPPVKFTKTAREALRRHTWPGNVRELQNRIQRALVLADGNIISAVELELALSDDGHENGQASLKEATQKYERSLITRALEKFDGNISKTARVLEISRPTLYEMMERYGLR